MAAASVVEVQSVCKVFGRQPELALHLLEQGSTAQQVFAETGMTVAVDHASFSVAAGEIFVVMGLSGSGKSTLLRMLNRLIEPTRGRITAAGQDVMALSRQELIQLRRDAMSMVFQSFALLPRQRVWENAAFSLEIAGVGRRQRRQRALEVLDLVGLKDYADSYPPQLSGGMQQRVGLARALASRPSLMLMDEAFSALDPLIRSEMQDELLRLRKASDLTIIFISHDLDEAMRIGDKIAILDAGRVVQVGSPLEILRRPADDFVRSFFRNVDVTKFYRVGDIASRDDILVVGSSLDVSELGRRLQKTGQRAAYLCDAGDRLRGIVTRVDIERGDASRLEDIVRNGPRLDPSTNIDAVMEDVMQHDFELPVVADGRLQGVLSRDAILRAVFRRSAGDAP